MAQRRRVSALSFIGGTRASAEYNMVNVADEQQGGL